MANGECGVRIAEYLHMPMDVLAVCIEVFDILAEEEGEGAYNFDADSGAGILFQDMQHMLFRCLDDKDSIPLMLSIITSKAFRLGAMYGRRVVPPEDRD